MDRPFSRLHREDHVSGFSMKVRLHFRSPLLLLFPRWVSGVTLGRHVFFRRGAKSVSPETIRHELIHVCQYLEHGFWGFLWRYLWRERHHPYREKSFEQEAFTHQHDRGYCTRRWPDIRLKLPGDFDV